VIRPEPGARVVFDGTGLESPEVLNFADGASHLLVEGLTVQNYAESFYLRSRHADITLRNLTISDVDNGLRGGNVDGLRVENVSVTRSRDDAFRLNSVRNAHFFNVTVSRTAGTAFNISNASNLQIQTSSIELARTSMRLSGPNLHVRGVRAFASNQGIALAPGSTGFLINNVVHSLIKLGPRAMGISLGAGSWSVLEHNTLARIDDVGVWLDRPEYARLRNNLITDVAGMLVEADLRSNIVQDNNHFEVDRFKGFIKASSSRVGAPVLTNPLERDFSPGANSPLRDAAGLLPYVDDDIKGKARGERADVGAFES
jgi:hypothetical protein